MVWCCCWRVKLVCKPIFREYAPYIRVHNNIQFNGSFLITLPRFWSINVRICKVAVFDYQSVSQNCMLVVGIMTIHLEMDFMTVIPREETMDLRQEIMVCAEVLPCSFDIHLCSRATLWQQIVPTPPRNDPIHQKLSPFPQLQLISIFTFVYTPHQRKHAQTMCLWLECPMLSRQLMPSLGHMLESSRQKHCVNIVIVL